MKALITIFIGLLVVGCESTKIDDPYDVYFKAKPIEWMIRIKLRKPTGVITKEDFDKVRDLKLQSWDSTDR